MKNTPPSGSPIPHAAAYILASHFRGTLYVGVTSNLPGRIESRRKDLIKGFTSRYRVHMLVWYEPKPSMYSAIVRERAIKEWQRAWKVRLIEEDRPDWRDL